MDVGPPRFEVPGYLDRSIVLAHNDELAVSVEAIACYSTGFAARIRLARRWVPFEDGHPPGVSELRIGLPHPRRGDHLLLGVEFPGGGDDGPDVVMTGGFGDDFAWEEEVWVEPLPRSGTVAFACAWPAEGVAETRVDVDAALFAEAAVRGRVLWPAE